MTVIFLFLRKNITCHKRSFVRKLQHLFVGTAKVVSLYKIKNSFWQSQNFSVKRTWTDFASFWKPCINIRRSTFRHNIQRSHVSWNTWSWSETIIKLWGSETSDWRPWRITWVSVHQWCHVYSKYWAVTCDTETINTKQAMHSKLESMLYIYLHGHLLNTMDRCNCQSQKVAPTTTSNALSLNYVPVQCAGVSLTKKIRAENDWLTIIRN